MKVHLLNCGCGYVNRKDKKTGKMVKWFQPSFTCLRHNPELAKGFADGKA